MSEYAIQNPGLAAICFIILCYALTRPFRYWAVVQKRRIRSADIQAHGWPKAPLDADGDIIHKDARP